MNEQEESALYLKPTILLIVALGVTFLVELLVMFLLHVVSDFSLFEEAFLDSVFLTFFAVPFLYFFILKPINKDIELRKRNKKEYDNLQIINRLKSDLIATAAHELRTPLTAIMGFTELLSDQELIGPITEEQRKKAIYHIYDNSERLNRLIDDLLDVSRIESGQGLSPDKKPHSIKDLLEKVTKHFKLTECRQILLNISSGVPDTLKFDEHRIDQLVHNILSNAIKYSSKSSTITLVADGDSDECRVTVIDQGIGMSKEQKSRIFEKFYRANATDTSIKGSGLGMSIVKQIVDDHDGIITIDSKLGEGTQVCFTLPITIKSTV